MSKYSLIVGFVVLSLVGLALVPRLSVQLTPSAAGRSLTVSYGWAGAAPEALERQVTARLEGAFAMLAGVQKIRSVSGYNRGYITLELDRATDVDATRFEVAALIRQVYRQLPRQLTYPQISLNNPAEESRDKPLLTLQLSGPVSPGALQRYADEQLKPRLAAVAGVGNVAVFGGTRPEWVLTYDASALTALQLTENELITAIQEQFKREPLGQIRQGAGQTLRVSLGNSDLAPPFVLGEGGPTGRLGRGTWHIPVANRAGRVIYLTDLVQITRQEPPPTSFYRINGKTAVNVVLSATAGANQLAVASALRQVIAGLPLPPGYRLDVEYDTTTYIRENLQKIGIQTGVAVLILLVFVAVTTRSWRYIWLIISSTVVTLLLSVGVFAALHVEIHLYSLAALTTSLGIVIDNVIVMIDHTRRYRDRRVFTALLGATLTTCAGLVVVWFLPEENRAALADFALVMAVTLLVSLLVSIGFVPAVMGQFWGQRGGKGREGGKGGKGREGGKGGERQRNLRTVLWLERLYISLLAILIRFRALAVTGAVLLFGLPVFWLPNKLEAPNPLAKPYNATLGSDWYVDELQPLINKWLGGTLRLFVNYVYEGSYQNEPERTSLYVIAELPNQSTPEQMEAVFRRFENEFSQYTEIDKFITQVNNGQEGSMVIYFRQPHDKGIFPYQLKNRAILLSTEMSGVDWDIFGVGQGFSQKLNEEETPAFTVEMFGYNYRQLETQAGVLARILEAHPRIQTVNINRSPGLFQHKNLYEFQLQTDSEILALHGTTAVGLYNRIAPYNARPEPTIFTFINDDYEALKIIPEQSQVIDIFGLKNQSLLIKNSVIKLNKVSTVVRKKVTPEIHKQDQQYRRVVSFEYFGSYNFGQKFLNKTLDSLRTKLPLGYTAKAMDRYWFGENKRTPYELIGLVVLLIYLICAVIFESLWQPLALIGLIPLSYIGVFLAFYETDSNFDQGGYASFILLAGNVVCAGIFIMAEMNRLRARFPRLSAFRAYQKAFRHKIGPVLLTVLSTVVGMIPFLLYEQEPFWYALGIGTIGGLLMSLLAVVIYLPLWLRLQS